MNQESYIELCPGSIKVTIQGNFFFEKNDQQKLDISRSKLKFSKFFKRHSLNKGLRVLRAEFQHPRPKNVAFNTLIKKTLKIKNLA